MSKAGNDNRDNPFARLDASRFPKAGSGGIARPSPKSGKTSAAPRKEETPALPDEALFAETFAQAEDEAGTFFSAIAGVTPLAGKGRKIPVPPSPSPLAVPLPGDPLRDLIEGRVEFALNNTADYVEGHVVGLDPLIMSKLQARRYSPESHIDLHGLNSEQAYHSLIAFFRAAYHKGARTTLVVTGQGRNSLGGVPVLRSKVQEWLVQEPFRRVVLAFCSARREDGGLGALYVLLRKYRKNSGKVRWDARPADPDLFL